MQTPKVSIVIPAYYAANYLAEAIDSALAQTYSDIEIIVVNDGSRDDGETERIALSYGDKIRYVRKENGGSSSALNAGIACMTGEWFSWLSHDDLYAPNKIQRQIEYLATLDVEPTDLSKQVVFSSVEWIDGNGGVLRPFREKAERRLSERVASFPHNGYLIAEPTVFNFYGCSCLIHKSVFEAIGGFCEQLRLINDMDMWYRLYKAGYRVHYIPEPLAKGRIHGKQISRSIGFSYANPEQDMFWGRSLDWLMENHPENYELFYRFGCNAYLKTRNSDGDRAFSRAMRLRPKAKVKLFCKKQYCKIYAAARNSVKQIYLKIRV